MSKPVSTQTADQHPSGATTPDTAVPAQAPADWLSAAVDGELTGEQLHVWQSQHADTGEQGELELQWRCYAAIGETLRETNASCQISDGAAFLTQFQQQFAAEETYMHHCHSDLAAKVQSLSSGQASNDTAFWKRAAGFLGVAAIAASAALYISQPANSPDGGLSAQTTLAQNSIRTAEVTPVVRGVSQSRDAAVVEATAANSRFGTDERVQRYLRAHRQYAGDPYWAQEPGLHQASFVGQ